MGNWRGFEQLAAQIYRELTPQAQVIHNDHIVGIDSGVPRQVDVSVRYIVAGHNLLMIIQAMDYNVPAVINTVGEFATVIRDLRANKGILVCRAGFTSGAVALANNFGIDLCNLHDAESRDWKLSISLPILWIDLLPNVQLGFQAQFEAGDWLSSNPQDWVLSQDNGRTRLRPFKTFVDAWDEGRLPRGISQAHRVVPQSLGEVKLLVQTAEGRQAWRDVDSIQLNYTVTQRAWLGSFTPEQCRGVFNYKDSTFKVSYLPIGAVPIERDASWKEIDTLDLLAVEIPRQIVTTVGWQIDGRTASFSEGKLTYLGEGEQG